MIKLRSLIHSSLITLTLLSASVGAVEKEYMLKAGFLYNFARFGHWDYHLGSLNEFIICSPDKYFIDAANNALKNRTIKNLPLYNKLITLDEVTTSACNMLFITSDTFIEWQNITPLELKNVMLIGETDTFIENGGHIRFFLSSGKIRFEIAPKQLKDAGITMSSKVLRLARVVDR
ncbi:YfiR family protein [Pseudoalteromonas sp. SG43-1]|uniref:YfiR family protein n=1 Tax=Pseudoalteromonas sp. SG43-1 TaxID=2760971 RepID=UPI0016023102|nr:YfiR family protein [Pseudoalteromonas sp. SG43-1]MBB1450718.1 YfiR family protein [Pseudoalteromonas sp. SG43-1]